MALTCMIADPGDESFDVFISHGMVLFVKWIWPDYALWPNR